MVMICPECGAENPDHADFCNLCHTTVGFKDAEYCGPPAFDEGYGKSYPSSFREDAPVPPPESFTRLPDAPPVDVGQYGRRSGASVGETPVPPPEAAAKPVDVGKYGVRTGHDPNEPGPEQYYYDSQHAGGGKKRRLRRRK